MKKTTISLILSFVAVSLVAGENHKSCDMKSHNSKKVSVTGKVSCKSETDCSFLTADPKVSFTVCEMSKADLPALNASGATVQVTGKLFTCDGVEKLQIEHVSSE